MKLHGNAALSCTGRRRLAERVVVEGWTLTAAAQAAGVSMRCARKWVGRYRLEGERGLLDRSSRPRRIANRTSEERIRVIVAMRRLRFTGPEIAELLGMAVSTVSGILTHRGMGRLGRLGLEQPVHTSGHGRASSSTSTSSGSVGSRAAPANAPSEASADLATIRPAPTSRASVVTPSATSTCTSASTTTAASRTWKCCPTRRRRPRSASWSGRPPFIGDGGSGSSGS
jgi:leucine-zipper of insertion element IS481